MRWLKSITVTAALMGCAAAWADHVELTNGDTISGQVVSLDATHVKLTSAVLGDLTLARENVAAVYFGERRAAKPAAAPAPPAAGAAAAPPAADDFIGKLLGKKPAGKPGAATPQDVVDGLQSGAIDPAAIEEVQKMFPLLASPEAGGYFQDTVGGLLSGKVGIGDIRKDAIKARDGIMELKKELGPDADALNPYLGILEKFLRETEEQK